MGDFGSEDLQVATFFNREMNKCVYVFHIDEHQ